MTDRELLELAAKAIGVKLYVSVSRYTKTTKYFSRKDGFQKPWNPLEDDGDALRMAVQLGITIDVDYKTQTANALWVDTRGNPASYKDQLSVFFGDGDPYAATRRAVVRAAAEIGRNLK